MTETQTLNIAKLIDRLQMKPHPEGGFFAERHYKHAGESRASSGSIYYYLNAQDASDFHCIDCDEYWGLITGSPLEIWIVSPEGNLHIEQLGLAENQEPLVYIPAGSTFAAKHLACADQGTLVSCITVPRFSYEGFRLVSKEELARLCPQALEYFDEHECSK